MGTLDGLGAWLGAEVGEALRARADALYEVRLRAGRPVQLLGMAGEWLSRAPLDAATLNRVLSALMEHSRYAREEELRQGFFTLSDGCRVGVSGRLVWADGRVLNMADIGSICLRISREVRGCAEALLPWVITDHGLRSLLILSPPGLGKTTLLRELARCLSEHGHNVCIADERYEIAACVNGVPTLDVGMRTDVMDGCPKRVAIPRMLRSLAPEVIIADEIGDAGDAQALAEAARCGVCVIATAHAGSFEQLFARRSLRSAMNVFATGALLGGSPGNIRETRSMGEEGHAIGAGVLRGGGLYAVRKRHVGGGAAAGGDAFIADAGHPGAEDPHAPHA